jgi:hypothetical protein
LLFDLGRLRLQALGRQPLLPTSRPDRFIGLVANSQEQKSPVDAVLVENWPAEFAKPK